MSQNKMLDWLDKNKGKEYGNFINGEWVKSGSNKVFSTYNPANKDQLLGCFQNSTKEDVNVAVAAAHETFKTWSHVPALERGAILVRFANLLEKNQEELAFMISAAQGKVLAESRGEVARAVKEALFVAGEASRMEGKTVPSERANTLNFTRYCPIGVVAAIIPWNFPVITPVRKIAPAIAYGCTVVYKPASATPWPSVRLMELLEEAGVPKGVVNMVTGSGIVGDAMVNDHLVRGISFTGSTVVGKGINESAAKRLAKVQLELGGKNPAVVLEYDNLEFAAKQIVAAAYTCSGQRCTAVSRVIVLKNKTKELTELLLKEIQNIKVGPAWDSGSNMGPLVNKAQLESVLEYVQIGKDEGARLLCGGEVLTQGEYSKGFYMTPALFDNVTRDMRIAREEIFGPVLSLISVENEQEAIETANDTDYGLAAAVFANDIAISCRFADKVESGMVHVNHGTTSESHMPFGGVKQSGHGPFSIGSSNLEFYSGIKVVYVQY